MDQIFVLRQLTEKSWEFNRNLHLIFVDCIKAYDSIHRESLLNILKEFQIPTKIINLISLCISETLAKIQKKTNDDLRSVSNTLWPSSGGFTFA